jgi:vacuolar-type H+-ATPase subunit C/Vma6
MELLRHLEDRQYPVEYLLSRIRGRRSRLIYDWRPLIYDDAPLDYLASARYQGFVRDRSPEGIWRSLLAEYRWVYSQMNHAYREIFMPFFLYTELRTIFICLRHLKEEKSGKAGELAGDSLLSAGIAKILSSSKDLSSAVRCIERAFLGLSEQFAGLSDAYEKEGLRGLELRLANTYLAVIAGRGLHPLMKIFFARLIDSRNIMSVYKYLRREERMVVSFIPGGIIPEAKLKATVEKRDPFGVNPLVREFCGIRIETTDPTKLETVLYKVMTRFLKKEGREPFGAGPILDYLWKCSLEVMNLSVLFYGKDLERETVTVELVQ